MNGYRQLAQVCHGRLGRLHARAQYELCRGGPADARSEIGEGRLVEEPGEDEQCPSSA